MSIRNAGEIVGDAVHKAIQAERRRVRRVVKKLTRYDVNKDYHENQMYLGVFTDGAYVRLDDLLTALKGTP